MISRTPCTTIKGASKRMRHKLQAVVVLIMLAALAVLSGQLEYDSRWYPGTVINGVALSGATLEDAITALHGSEYSITVQSRDGGTDTFSAEEFSLQSDVTEQLTALFEEQHNGLFVFSLFTGVGETNLTFSVSYDADAVLSALESSVLVTGSDDYVITQPAGISVEWNGSIFEVTEVIDGNVLIVEDAAAAICSALDTLETQIDLSQLDVYEVPSDEDTPEDPEALCAQANAYVLHWINWDMGDDTTESLTPEDLVDWITIEDDEVYFDEDALCDWVEAFCKKYKTVGTDREFTTHDGEVITISGGDYGWRLNYEEICEDALQAVEDTDEDAIAAYIADQTDETQAALTVSLEPVYKNTAYQTDYETFMYDWDPDNYSEVDLSEQMVYVYKDGELAYSCICVTGLPDGDRDTTTGVWYIKDKKLTYTLTSTTYNYSTPTKYWIRITWTGIGYHYKNRSDWSSWSNTLYQTAGSHGCVNLQLEDAEAVYNLVSLYDAVFIHW